MISFHVKLCCGRTVLTSLLQWTEDRFLPGDRDDVGGACWGVETGLETLAKAARMSGRLPCGAFLLPGRQEPWWKVIALRTPMSQSQSDSSTKLKWPFTSDWTMVLTPIGHVHDVCSSSSRWWPVRHCYLNSFWFHTPLHVIQLSHNATLSLQAVFT